MSSAKKVATRIRRMRKFKSKRYKRLTAAIAKTVDLRIRREGKAGASGLSPRQKKLFAALDKERMRLLKKGLDPS